ncbi:hypothetical protein Tco_0783392 [Tanacetum coccineum]
MRTSETSVTLMIHAWKKALNLLKKGLLVRGEAMEASKRRRSMVDHRIQQLSKGLSEGSSIILEVPDEPKDNFGSTITEKLASTPTPPTTQAQVYICSTSCWKDGSKEAWNALLVQESLR